jgi:hypothetical protein
MYFPTPTELASAIVESSLDEARKKRALNAVQLMNRVQVAQLYEQLMELAELDREFIAEVQKNDLKYRIEFEKAVEAAREEERNS